METEENQVIAAVAEDEVEPEEPVEEPKD